MKASTELDNIVGFGDNKLIIPSGSSLFRWPRASRGADFFSARRHSRRG